MAIDPYSLPSTQVVKLTIREVGAYARSAAILELNGKHYLRLCPSLELGRKAMSQYLAIALLVLASWIVLRFRGGKSVLDNLPGPQPTSWLAGAWCSRPLSAVFGADTNNV